MKHNCAAFLPHHPIRRLSDLCVDDRAAVRKSASQTLFSTISAHGTLLQRETWQGVLWQVGHVIIM